jgi:ferredoxin
MGDADNLEIIVERDECIGDGACVADAPETFDLDDEQKAIVKPGPWDAKDAILEAAGNCPVECIKVKDKKTGQQICPKP